MLRLHNIADDEEGWIQVVKSMVNVVPMSDPLGPSVITLLLDDCPLPSRNSIVEVTKMFNLSGRSAILGRSYPPRERNICVVLGCIAEKLAGPSNLGILNEDTLDYLITNLVSGFGNQSFYSPCQLFTKILNRYITENCRYMVS